MAAVVQTIPSVSPLSPWTAWMPLGMVIGISMVKEALEDLKRRKNDRIVNNKRCKVWREGKWLIYFWRDLQVGDIIKLEDNEDVPADLVVLGCSDAG